MDIAPQTFGVLTDAVTQLYIQSRESGYCDVLLDPLAGFPLKDQIEALDERVAPRTYLADPLFKESPQDAPFLLRVPVGEWSLLEAFVAVAQQEAILPGNTLRSVCGFLQSPLSMAQLAKSLTRALDLRVESRGMYFRYFDPRIFHHLPRLLPSHRLGSLLTGVTRWSYCIWDGSMVMQDIPAGPSIATWRVQLTQQQWQAFEAIEHFNATQKLFLQCGLPFIPAQIAALFAQVQTAIASGLRTPTDVAYYLACCQQNVSPLAQHPAWSEVLTLVQAEVPLADALKQRCGVALTGMQAVSTYQLIT